MTEYSSDLRFGATVMGTDGKLGEIHRAIIDAQTDTVTDLVVTHGFAFGTERMVPLSYVDRVDADGTVHVTLDEQRFATMEGFTDAHFHAPDPSYLGPPGFATEQYLLDTALVGGADVGGGFVGKPLGYPGGEQISPDAMQRPTISSGTPIVDRDGEQVGEVHELTWKAEGGEPTRLVMRTGHLFHTETELPLSWVGELSDKGIVLTADKSQIESLSEPGLAEDQARAAGLSQAIDRTELDAADAAETARRTRQHMVAELDAQRTERDHARAIDAGTAPE